jgi:hypothetical protein
VSFNLTFASITSKNKGVSNSSWSDWGFQNRYPNFPRFVVFDGGVVNIGHVLKIVVDFFPGRSKIQNMKAHTITYQCHGTHKVELPAGRYLKVGETIQKGDLKLWTDAAPEDVDSVDCAKRGFSSGQR